MGIVGGGVVVAMMLAGDGLCYGIFYIIMKFE